MPEEVGILLLWDKYYVPNTQYLRNIVLNEKHNVPYTSHIGYQKKFAIVRGKYYCPGLKKYWPFLNGNVYGSKCLVMQVRA
jgi:hypothetical protein